MDQKQFVKQISDLFESACTELFQSLDCNVEKLDASSVNFDTGDVPRATIDAGADDFEMELSLHLPFSGLAMTYPLQENITTIDESELEDWIAELSNRLLGDVKVKLRAHQCDLSVGLPSYCFGDDEPISTEGKECHVSIFNIDNEFFQATMALELLSDPIAFSEQAVAANDPVEQGVLEFF